MQILADVEPILRFPARIGLAKIHQGQLVNISADEMYAWGKAKEELGKDFGEFVPLSPLIAESVYSSLNPTYNAYSYNQASEVLRKVRLGAARQHLEAVLVYESFSDTNSRKLATSIANWTLIGGYFVPTRELQTVGFANALLLDVRNGYPYGTANATLTDKDRVTLYFKCDRQKKLAMSNELKTILKLVPEVAMMFEKLKKELPQSSNASS